MEQLDFNAESDDSAQAARADRRSPTAITWACWPRRIARAGYRVATADSAQAAFAEMYRMPPDALVSELTMTGTGGVELARMIREDAVHHELPLIMIGGKREAAAADQRAAAPAPTTSSASRSTSMC